MDVFATLDAPRALLFTGLGLWLLIAVLNNIIDRGTNVFLLGIMFSMRLLKEDPQMGNGLKHRAIDDTRFHAVALTVIVAIQFVVVAALLFAGLNYLLSWTGAPLSDPRGTGNAAAMAFGALWLFFMSGGLWFGYWMKQVQVQQVHMTLLLFTFGLVVIVNLPG